MTHIRSQFLAPRARPHLQSRRIRLVDEVVESRRPDLPLFCLRPQALHDSARAFVTGFPGTALYAVKCNPDPAVLRGLWDGGIRHFDCASAGEVELVRRTLPRAQIHFMHPIKARSAIREAWERHHVRDFVIDSAAELGKVMEETRHRPGALGIVVRLALPKGGARYDLSGKFGAPHDEAVSLLRMASAVAARIGISFHVGSQCCDPAAWTRALDIAGRVLADYGRPVDIVDVGGGFPVSYPDVTPPPLGDFFAAIADGFARLNLPATTQLWCEPGRALVAGAQSLVVRVEGRRGDHLFINDGIYGGLSDAGVPAFRFPCRLIRAGGASSAPLVPFAFFGPTCDSADRMEGPFLLPADSREGDWIEIGQLGAYGACLRTGFNGFDRVLSVEVDDLPMLFTPGLTHFAQAA
ncbi:MAG: type III PLP-dependent enzyme [Magnetospirillum sp.]